ncbi:MAG TPA: hypothetical protein PK825_04320 [Bacteroidales bacterium]|nr:hypothetical protein [Bacteroidales bacterium]
MLLMNVYGLRVGQGNEYSSSPEPQQNPAYTGLAVFMSCLTIKNTLAG